MIGIEVKYICVNGHDRCYGGLSAGPECPYCEIEDKETCPDCGEPLIAAHGGGVVCSKKCGYWFCF